MYVTNVLLPDQTENRAARERAAALAAEPLLSYTQATIDPARAAADRGEGIFRGLGWRARRRRRIGPPIRRSPTPRVRNGRHSIRCVTIRFLHCRPPGMPQVITRKRPLRIRFVQSGSDVVLKKRVSRDRSRDPHDRGRGDQPSRAHAARLLPGKWDGAALVVTTTTSTTRTSSLYGLEGVPQSTEMTLVERFTPSAFVEHAILRRNSKPGVQRKVR